MESRRIKTSLEEIQDEVEIFEAIIKTKDDLIIELRDAVKGMIEYGECCNCQYGCFGDESTEKVKKLLERC